MSELREDLAAMVGRKNALARMKMETNAGCESDLSTVGTSVAPQATEPPRRQKSHLPPAHNPVQGLKSNPKPVHKLIQALGKNQEENPDRALQRVQKEEDDDEDEGSSVLSYRMNGAPSEFTAPLPFAPSPPPVTRRSSKKPQHLHHPPLGAADLWYQEVDSGLREVEQDWVNAGELWEEDQRPPEAPSPPLSRVFTPGMERSRGPPGGRMRQEHSYHSTGGYDYNYRPAGY